MAISVLEHNGGPCTSASATTITFSSTILANDLCVVTMTRRNTATSTSVMTTSGYATVHANIYANATTDDCNLITYYKFLSAGETTAVITAALASNVQSYCYAVLRGVDTTTPFEVLSADSSTINAVASPDASALTPLTAGSYVIAVGGAVGNTTAPVATALGNPSNMNATLFSHGDNARAMTGMAMLDTWVSGSFDPAAFSGGTTTTVAAVAAKAFTVKPLAVGTTGRIKVWNGSAFVAKPVKVWSGSAWVIKPLKRWNGSAWVVTNY